MRERGRVSWFNDAKGFGFIKPDSGKCDVFVHYTGIDSRDKRRRLLDGQIVEYERKPDRKGPMAINVTVVTP